MESIAVNVSDLSADQRHTIEGVLGQPLSDGQRVIVQVVESALREARVEKPAASQGEAPELPEWATIFADLSDEEFAELQAVFLQRADLSRSVEVGD